MKKLWLLQNLWINDEAEYLIFESEDKATEYAEEHGAFELCCGSDHWKDLHSEIIFEINENDLHHYIEGIAA